MRKNSRELLLRDVVVSVVLITQNDADIITDVLKEINRVLLKSYLNYEILVIDNYSDDDTVEKIRNSHPRTSHTRIIQLSKRYDTELALTAGLDNCIGDYVVLFNIYTDPPYMIPVLIDKLLERNDIVLGRYKGNLLRQNILNTIFLSSIRKLSSHEFTYSSNYLTGFNRKTINSITRIRRKTRNFSYINSLIGFKKTVVSYKPLKKYLSRLEQENFITLFLRITDIIISNSFSPMRVLVILGMLISLMFLLYAFIIAIVAIFLNKRLAPEGWISTSAVLGTMFFLLFSLLSLMSEYLIRVLNESRDEPLYFISEETDKSIIPVKRNKMNVI